MAQLVKPEIRTNYSRAGWTPATLFPTQSPSNCCRKAAEVCVMSWVPGIAWNTKVEFLGPGFGLVEPWLLLPFTKQINGGKISSVSPPVSFHLWSKDTKISSKNERMNYSMFEMCESHLVPCFTAWVIIIILVFFSIDYKFILLILWISNCAQIHNITILEFYFIYIYFYFSKFS